MLSESQQRKIIAQEPKFIEKLQRLEALSIQLGKLLGNTIFVLQKSLGYPEGRWYLDVNWSHYGYGVPGGGHDEVTYVVLEKRVKGWVRRKWVKVMAYQRDFETDIRDETRHLFTFEDSVIAVLDTLSDELEEQITRASLETAEHREQFSKVVEEHPREVKNRFDQIDSIQ